MHNIFNVFARDDNYTDTEERYNEVMIIICYGMSFYCKGHFGLSDSITCTSHFLRYNFTQVALYFIIIIAVPKLLPPSQSFCLDSIQ